MRVGSGAPSDDDECVVRGGDYQHEGEVQSRVLVMTIGWVSYICQFFPFRFFVWVS
jgi:hypothetical protein